MTAPAIAARASVASPPGMPGGYHLPLSDRAYDRTPVLRAAERAALAAYVRAWSTRRSRGETVDPAPVLARFVTPLGNVFGRWQAEGGVEVRHHRRRFLRVVLDAMHQHRAPYWAWPPDVWRALAGRGALRDA